MQFKMEKAIMNRCMNGWGMKKCSWFRKASSEGRKERSLPFYRPNHTSSLLWGWSLEEGKKQCLDLAESLPCFVSFRWEGPRLSEHKRWMDSWNGPSGKTVTLQLFGSRCLLFGSTSKGETWTILSVGYLRSRTSFRVLFFSKIDRKSCIMCLQSHCGFTKMRQTNIS